MLGTRLVLIALGAWFILAPVVAVMVGRALKAADPHSGYELAARRASVPARGTPRTRPLRRPTAAIVR